MKPRSALVITCLAVASSAAAGETIAVMDFTAANASTSEAVAVSGFVRNSVVRSATYTVVDKKNMDRILQEQAFQQTGCTSQECAVKLGKLLNVKKMIVGEYTLLGGTRFLTASLVDVESGRIERSGKVKGFDVGNADEAADQLVDQLEGRATVQRTTAQPAPQPVESGLTKQVAPAPAVTPTWTPPTTPKRMRGYLSVHAGPVMSTKLSNLTRTSDYTWSSGTHEDEKLYIFKYSDIEMETTGPSFGARFGFSQGAFGLDLELSHIEATNVPNQNVNVTTTGYYWNGFGYSPYQDYSFSAKPNLLTVNVWDFAMNLLLTGTHEKFVPYLGIGFGFAIMNVSSDVYVDQYGAPLDSAAMGFTLQIPIGLRLYPTPKFFLWSEFKPAFMPLIVGYKTDKPTATSTDTFTLQGSQLSLGVGFGF